MGEILTYTYLALLFLTETQIARPSDTTYLQYPGYKREHNFMRHAGVAVFIREDLIFRRLAHFEGRDLSIIWLRVDSDDRARVYTCLYRSHNGNAETDLLMEHIQSAIDDILLLLPT